jgi:hypothetical protein
MINKVSFLKNQINNLHKKLLKSYKQKNLIKIFINWKEMYHQDKTFGNNFANLTVGVFPMLPSILLIFINS